MNRFDGFAAGSYKSTSYQREGLYRHGAYADNSFGKGKKLSFDALSGKAGLTYKLSGIHLFDANAAWMQRAPHLRNTYANSRENHYVVGELAGRDLELEELTAFDISYILTSTQNSQPGSLLIIQQLPMLVKFLSFLQKELEETLHLLYKKFLRILIRSIKGLSLDLKPMFSRRLI